MDGNDELISFDEPAMANERMEVCGFPQPRTTEEYVLQTPYREYPIILCFRHGSVQSAILVQSNLDRQGIS